jgi:hypothetical protein
MTNTAAFAGRAAVGQCCWGSTVSLRQGNLADLKCRSGDHVFLSLGSRIPRKPFHRPARWSDGAKVALLENFNDWKSRYIRNLVPYALARGRRASAELAVAVTSAEGNEPSKGDALRANAT